jgi:two-component system sensor histidine kinase BaeS
MFRTLRNRFILSHILPLLITVPLIGIALIYLLEVNVLLPTLTNELTSQAQLLIDLAHDQPDVWTDAAQAQAFVTRVHAPLNARLMLIDHRGRLLASNDPRDTARTGQMIAQPDLSRALAGEPQTYQEYAPRLGTEIADVLVPSVQASGQVDGVVRLSYELAGVYERFSQLRLLVAGVLIVGVLLGAALGYVLAVNLERPIQRLTLAVRQLAAPQQFAGGVQAWQPLPETPPEEIALLIRALNQLVAQLNSLENARRQLLANMVHELGRPLGALQSATHALRGGADEDSALRRELLSGMDDEIRRLRYILDDLVGHYDQALGVLKLNRQPVELNAWLTEVLITWREAAARKGLEWSVTAASDDVHLTVDADRLAQAVGNLVSNAIKFTPRGGAVSIELLTDRDQVGIRVRDTGPGISQADQVHIFEPFFRSRSIRRFPQGMGLGLTIAQEIVTAHGGRLEFTSTAGQGTMFTIWLPLDARSQ